MVADKFYIIGAGISGLTLGYELLKQGCKVEIFEKNSYIGGLATTINFDGYPIDTGPHIFHSAHSEIINYWKELVGEKLVAKSFYSGNYKNGKIYDYPINKETMNEQYDIIELQKIKHDLKNIDLDKLSNSKNYYEYVRALAGDYLSEMFFTYYPKKLWGLNTRELSARFAPRRIEIRDKKRPFHSGPGRFAGAIEGGCGHLSKELEKRIISLGGKINKSHFLKKIGFLNQDAFDSVLNLYFNDNKKINVQNNNVISTLPIDYNASMFNVKTNLYFRSIFLVNIIVSGKDPFPKNYDWLYFDDSIIPFHRAGVQTRFSRVGVPKNKHIICSEIAFDGKISEEKKQKLIDNTVKSLERLKLIPKNIDSVYGIDIGPVYPGYFTGHEKELSRINAIFGKCKNFYTLGSLADYAYSDLQVLTAKAIDLGKDLATTKDSLKSDLLKDYTEKKPSNKFSFGNKIISKDNSSNVFLIAEIGLAHNGSVENCKRLIEEAKLSGFDSAKIQTYSKGRISKKTRTARYYEESLDQEENISDYLDKIIFTQTELNEIFNFAKKIDMELFSTPFDKKSVDMLMDFDVAGFKISSMDIVNLPLIKYVASKNKPIILSTGMTSLGEIEDAISSCLEIGNSKVAILHCVSSYPCPLEFVNLKKIKNISNTFNVISGLSDHTVEIETPALAIVSGARIVEKHITLDKNMDGPDHNFSLIPSEMKKMVSLARKSELAISSSEKTSSAELSSKQNLRRSIYASVSLNAGDIVTPETICIKSPGDGIPARYYDLLIGKRLISAIQEDLPLSWKNFLNE